MSKIKKQLIRLGRKEPSLRKHLRPVLDVVSSQSKKSRFQETIVDDIRMNIHDYGSARKAIVRNLDKLIDTLERDSLEWETAYQVKHDLEQREGDDHPVEDLEMLLAEFPLP